MIETLVNQVASRLGLGAEQSGQAVGAFLALMKSFGDGDAVGNLLKMIPGAEALSDANASVVENDGGGGLLSGGLAGMAGSLLGGQAGDLMKAVGALKSVGLDADQGKDLAETTLKFFNDNAKGPALDAALDSLPWLKNLL